MEKIEHVDSLVMERRDNMYLVRGKKTKKSDGSVRIINGRETFQID